MVHGLMATTGIILVIDSNDKFIPTNVHFLNGTCNAKICHIYLNGTCKIKIHPTLL
jgi:hypothetical protein